MPLYTFTDGTTPDQFTFTNCGKTGPTGPSLSDCRTSYGGSLNDGSWWNDNSNNWLDMTTNGIQKWIVPQSGTYSIEVWGAAGGGSQYTSGGSGQKIKSEFGGNQHMFSAEGRGTRRQALGRRRKSW